jgi:alkylation response protein AidB-like acyl-CoA dehydrogenase
MSLVAGGLRGVVLPDDFYCRDDEERGWLDRCSQLAARFASRAEAHDREGSFPHENFEDLRRAGYLSLTVPRAYGGSGGGVFLMVLCQEALARGDGSTALGAGWHQMTLGRLAARPTWPAAAVERVFRAAVERGALINAAVSEPETGSPSRGGRPTTTARRTADGWVLRGRKVFTTMAPGIATFVVSATAEGIPETASFLVPREAPGVSVVETWDALGMRASGSHDLLLDDVPLPSAALVEPAPPTPQGALDAGAEVRGGSTAGWGLHIPATYLGVARAAVDYAVAFAVQRRPNSLQGSIAEVPHVQEKIGEMQRQLLGAYNLLFTLARRWDDDPEAREVMAGAVGACKTLVLDAALRVVDLAARVVGAAGLVRGVPIERYYRDVRPGLHNPPMEDAVLVSLARQAVHQAEAALAR